MRAARGRGRGGICSGRLIGWKCLYKMFDPTGFNN